MTPYYQDEWLTVYGGDCREVMRSMAPESVHCVVTSPPYWGLRDYGQTGQLGLEATPEEYVANMVDVFREVRRVLRNDGTVWLNLGDSYAATASARDVGRSLSITQKQEMRARGEKVEGATFGNHAREIPYGLKPKDLVGIPWRVAFALQADGWYLRSDIVWNKVNPMPESVTDRPTKSHEYVFLLSKSPRYFFDADAVREPASYPDGMNGRQPVTSPHGQGFAAGRSNGATASGRNLRSVWTIATTPYGNVRVKRAGYGGSDHRASPDCPVHGDQHRQDSTAGRGERRAASDPDRRPRTDPRPEQGQLVGLAPTDPLPDADSAPDSSGSPYPAYGSAATLRSSESRRTDPAPLTSPHESGVEGSATDIERSEPTLGSSATDDRTPASSIAVGSGEGDTGPSSSAGTPADTACTCTYWESLSHFAVFPRKLVEPCVKAGCPENGLVLDPFAGSGTTGVVAQHLGRRAVLIDLNPDYLTQAMARNRDIPLGLVG